MAKKVAQDGSRAIAESSSLRIESPGLLNAKEVGALLGIGPKRVYELGIDFVQVGIRSKRWNPATVSAWVQDRTRREAA